MKSSVTVAALGALLLTVYLKRRSKKRPPLPPGPPADPLIGHLRIMPTDKQELVFHEWSKTYGAFRLYWNQVPMLMVMS